MLLNIFILALSLRVSQASTALDDPCADKKITLPWGTYKAKTLDVKKEACLLFNSQCFCFLSYPLQTFSSCRQPY